MKDDSAIATTIKQTTLPPIFRWAGGKRKHTWLFDAIAKIFDADKHRLVEPFVGGMAIALGLEPEQALLNDVNPHVINFYHQIKMGVGREYELMLKYSDFSAEEYYRRRSLFNDPSMTPSQSARFFYYLNRTCYNGLCRFNQSGGFNTPYGKLKKPKVDHDFNLYRDRFQNWQFSNLDFESLEIYSGDIVVADPPYDVIEGKQDHDYSKGGFDWVDQVRCADWLASLDVPVIACNLATDRIVKLYEGLGFRLEYVNAPRAIACNGDRRPVREILAFKNI